jgi:ATP:ADP antiporter, AAA family
MMVRESEREIVSRLLTFEFFQGAAIAIFYQVALSLFIHGIERPTIELPKVFIISAFVLWGTGYLYHKLEHLLPVPRLVLMVLLINTSAILLYAIMMPTMEHQHPGLLYAFLASYNAIYLLNNLEFWGVASMLFDVRQSKRLFSIVSSGDIPAKLIGFLLVTVINLTHTFEPALACPGADTRFTHVLFPAHAVEGDAGHTLGWRPPWPCDGENQEDPVHDRRRQTYPQPRPHFILFDVLPHPGQLHHVCPGQGEF